MKVVIIPVSLTGLDYIPDKLSVSSQSDDRNPHTADGLIAQLVEL